MDGLHYQLDLLTALNKKLSSNEKMYRLICNTSSNAFLYCNLKEGKCETAGNWDKLFDFKIFDLRDLNRISECMLEGDRAVLQEVLFLEKTGRGSMTVECFFSEKLKCVACTAHVFYDENGVPAEKVICIEDITKIKRQSDELDYMTYYDALTGLYNRNYFIRTLNNWIRKAEEETSVISVMFVDVDDFHKINDGLGMLIGDELVQVFGQYLNEFKTEHIMISHFNSDVFCIAVYAPCESRNVEKIIRKIHERVKEPFLLSGKQEITISVGIGVAEFPEAAQGALELINCAEIVMFRAKAKGNNGVQYFDTPILNKFLENVTIEHKLKDAVLAKKFILHFQPQYDARENVLRGVEALIRWRDEDGSLISPGVFIPIAEKNGSIIPIGEWVLEESLATFARWKRKYELPLVLSINISAIQYNKEDFVYKLIQMLRKYQVNPLEIELEITESVLIDDFDDVVGKMHMLRDYGIRVSLDDFGTGFSSLSYLKGLPIDTLKIDKSFIDTVTSDDTTRIITESIISMVKKLGFETVAEGVETEEQFEYLKTIECDNIQGYYLGKPMDSSEIERLLMKQLCLQ